ncbi:MAG: hypothetical protein IPH60_08550 [Flavobacteriales bacterium]|nr:hypothetical protein [Flavobacteriales bacterium]
MQSGHNGQTIFPIDKIIADVERYMLLDEGDRSSQALPPVLGRSKQATDWKATCSVNCFST